jgi:hypothetical protein
LTKEAAEKIGIQLVAMDELLQKSDYITIHTPLNDKTRRLINKDVFRKMKKGVYLINCARGGVVDEAIESLQSRDPVFIERGFSLSPHSVCLHVVCHADVDAVCGRQQWDIEVLKVRLVICARVNPCNLHHRPPS